MFYGIFNATRILPGQAWAILAEDWMITDIEMNGTARGAVETFNLCSNLRSKDALVAECVRRLPGLYPQDYRLRVFRILVSARDCPGGMRVALTIP